VAVAVERDLDRAVPEVGGESLGVDAGCDQDRGEGVPRLVETDRLKLRLLPRLLCTGNEAVAIERLRSVAEEQCAAFSASQFSRS
jgi:hypothetical protein